jgi:arsenate reductase
MQDETYNDSARSILAEVHPLALEELERHHLQTRGLRSKSWDEFARPAAPMMHFAFTMCHQAASEACPVWPATPVTAHLGVPDPAAITGSGAQQPKAFRDAYFALETRINIFVALPVERRDRLAIKREVEAIGHLRLVGAGARAP